MCACATAETARTGRGHLHCNGNNNVSNWNALGTTGREKFVGNSVILSAKYQLTQCKLGVLCPIRLKCLAEEER